MEDVARRRGTALSGPVRLASVSLPDLPLDGQINLLTTTSFDRPQNLFSSQAAPSMSPSSSLTAPPNGGQWTMRGRPSAGRPVVLDRRGWYITSRPAAHTAIEAGLSYGMQRYLGGNGEALAAMADGPPQRR